jgi:hypothetical protein
MTIRLNPIQPGASEEELQRWREQVQQILNSSSALDGSLVDITNLTGLEHGVHVDNPSEGVHGVSGDIVGTTDDQTLTNKELTSPTITGGTLTNSTLTSPAINSSVSGSAIKDTINANTSLLVTENAVKEYADAIVFEQTAPVACKVQLTSNATVGAGSTLCVSWDADSDASAAKGSVFDLYDDADYWDSGNPKRLTAPSDGIYMMSVQIQWASNSTYTAHINIKLNDEGNNATNAISSMKYTRTNESNDNMVLTAFYRLTQGDYVSVSVKNSSVASEDLAGGTSLDTSFSIVRLGDIST